MRSFEAVNGIGAHPRSHPTLALSMQVSRDFEFEAGERA